MKLLKTLQKKLSFFGRLRGALYIVLLTSYISNAQQVVWQKHYGNNRSEELYDIIKVGDYYYAGGSSCTR